MRPPTVEQLAFSIAHSYGQARRIELMDLIVRELGQPNDYKWTDEKFMITWTDMAFLQLFIDQLRREYFKADGSPKPKAPKQISRPSRALIWLVRSLLDYTVQNTLNFGIIHSQITYGVQSDKAGSFSGAASLKHLSSPEFLEPRVTRTELGEVLSPSSTQYLLPERRLDAAIAIQHLAEELSRQADLRD